MVQNTVYKSVLLTSEDMWTKMAGEQAKGLSLKEIAKLVIVFLSRWGHSIRKYNQLLSYRLGKSSEKVFFSLKKSVDNTSFNNI